MTAASGGPGEKPDYEGHPASGFDVPPADPAYGGWQPAVVDPPAADYPSAYSPPWVPAAGYGGGYPPPPAYPPFPGYPPQYGSPAPDGYGYQGYQGYPGYPVAARPGVNVLAIISLVSSVSGLLCSLGSLAGIITGAVAIAQVKRTGGKGFGLAVAGTAAGVAGLLMYLVMVVYSLQQR
jgi:hypothetical protein